jgi:predicted regulator of Ras-like GTPase activity (Roadblock/LC7/MglB family)
MIYTFGQEQLDQIENILNEELVENGAHCVLLINMAGNIVAKKDNGKIDHDEHSLAALAAGNFGAVEAMAKIVGEQEFSLLFHKGKKESIHFSKIGDEFLMITIFGKDISLGLLRLKVEEAIEKISKVWKRL